MKLLHPFLSIAFSSLTWLTTGDAIAQIGLGPMVIQEEMARNRAHSILNVLNPSDQPIRIRIYSQPFTYDRETGFTYLAESEHDLTPYLQFSPKEFVIPPREQQRVRLIALFPPDLPESEYRAIVLTETLEDTSTASTSSNTANIQTRIGSTVYVRQAEVEPNLAVAIAQWNAETNQIDLLVTNTGGATARPDARWTLLQGDESIATGKSGYTTVIAEGDRFLRLRFEPGTELPSSGNYELTGKLVWMIDAETYEQPFSTPLSIP